MPNNATLLAVATLYLAAAAAGLWWRIRRLERALRQHQAGGASHDG